MIINNAATLGMEIPTGIVNATDFKKLIKISDSQTNQLMKGWFRANEMIREAPKKYQALVEMAEGLKTPGAKEEMLKKLARDKAELMEEFMKLRKDIGGFLVKDLAKGLAK